MRLNVFIAKSGYASRRKVDSLIKEGKVLVRGRVVRQPFFDVKRGERVEVDKRLLSLKEFSYVIFNKPKGVTTTQADKFATFKVVDFLPQKLKKLYPVGRLDKNSTGLLILTNDGQLCYELTHPKFEIEKEYLVLVNGKVVPRDCKAAKKGIFDEGESLRVKQISILRQEANESLCKVVVCEGKKRHLRRLFKGLGFEVKALKRVRIADLVLGGLGEGKYRVLSRKKIHSLLFKKT